MLTPGKVTLREGFIPPEENFYTTTAPPYSTACLLLAYLRAGHGLDGFTPTAQKWKFPKLIFLIL